MRRTLVVFASSLVLTACNGEADTDQSAAPDVDVIATGGVEDTAMAPSTTATAPMRDASGHDLGTLTLSEEAAGITVSGTLTGMPPGTHAIHVHMTGRCEPPFESAGGHWNPTNNQHGTENPRGPHFGDLPNLTVGADSTVTVQATTPGGTLRGANALLDADGAAVVVHAQADDYRTDPAGGAGDRIACGVVSGA
jgi:Cu-Zn family superoxide dismutase